MYYKAKPAIKGAIDGIKYRINARRLNNQSRDDYIDEHHANAGNLNATGLKCRASEDGIITLATNEPGNWSGVRYAGQQAKIATVPVLSFSDALKIASWIDKLSIKSGYLNAKTDDDWKEVYGMETRKLSVMDGAGTITPTDFECLPCHNCGIVLPKECIQVDHYMPQAGSKDHQLLKMIRALGLTAGVATGGKGAQVRDILRSTSTQIYPKGNNIGNYQFDAGTSAANKWTTNDRGKAFLSLAKSDPDTFSCIRRVCEDSIINLAPLCPSCNINKGNRVKGIV